MVLSRDKIKEVARKITSGIHQGQHPVVNHIVDRLHVGLSDSQVVDHLHKSISAGLSASDPAHVGIIKRLESCALSRHHQNQKQYRQVMGGTFSR